MKFVLFVEGDTERVLKDFLKRWLDVRLSDKVHVDIFNFQGCYKLIKKTPKKANMYLSQSDVIGVISLLDLYCPDFYPKDIKNVHERYKWAKDKLEKEVGQPKFRQFFAVHETEAWLLSDPAIFPQEIRTAIELFPKKPEEVDFDHPPAKRLNDLYLEHLHKGYKKVVDGNQLFKKLDPNAVYSKCPHFKEMMDEMLKMAKESGL